MRPLAGPFVAALLCAVGAAHAQPAGGVEPDGTVLVPPFRLPPSIYLSDEAKKALPRKAVDPEEGGARLLAAGKVPESREMVPKAMESQRKHLIALFPVTIRETKIAGVPAVIVTPARGVPPQNREKILLNLPGGGFLLGSAPGTGMLETIPLAAKAQVEIVSISYREAPEAQFPAASEDVAAVYRELLKTHKPEDIGLFGCSAGGLLAAEAIAWFHKASLPMPGAVGLFCASADARPGSDSLAWTRPLLGVPSLPTRTPAYFGAHDLNDPLVSPIVSPEILRAFPPTLILTATRAHDLSAAVNTHRELIKAGVDAELHVWDGLSHAFFYNIDLPESREAFDVMAGFFRKHLNLAPPAAG
jgi:acetyl esterase/lipase